jgi:hypothetical protein
MAQKLSDVTGTPVPRQILALKDKPERHGKVVGIDGMKQAVIEVI